MRPRERFPINGFGGHSLALVVLRNMELLVAKVDLEYHMRKKNLEVCQAALKIAGAGKAKNWKEIQEELVRRGYASAPQLVDGQKIRAILDLRYHESRNAH